MNYTRAWNEIESALETFPIVDTHEHVQPQGALGAVSLFDLFDDFLVSDLVSSGMSLEDGEEAPLDLTERWQRLKPFMPYVQTTTYFRFYLAAFVNLFNFKGNKIEDHNWRDLSEKITNANERDDWYQTVLKEKSHLEVAFLDRKLLDEWDVTSKLLVPMGNEEIDRDFFLPVLRADSFLYVRSRNRIAASILPPKRKQMWSKRIDLLHRLEEEWGASTETLADYEDFIEIAFKRTIAKGGISVKLICAYERSLNFEPVSHQDAERIFGLSEERVSLLDAKKLEDYLAGVIIERAIEHDLPIQIHTGMQGGNGNIINNANPMHLNTLFLRYPDAKFDLFHAGIPFTRESGIVAKMFPNVYVNICWLPQLSDTVAKHTLHELIDLVPGNKILWGGDCFYVELVYGAMLFSKRIVTDVLAEKVSQGQFGLEAAIDLARNIFRENAIKLYHLEERNCQPV